MFGDEDEFGFEERESLDTALNEVYPLKGMKLFYSTAPIVALLFASVDASRWTKK